METTSASAISGLDKPATSKRSTRCSCGLSASMSRAETGELYVNEAPCPSCCWVKACSNVCTYVSERSFLIVGKTTRCKAARSEEHTSELQSQSNLVCRL